MSARKSAAASASSADDELLDSLIAQQPSALGGQASLLHRLLYFLAAVVVTAVPIYLYWSIFDLDLEDNAALFGAVTLIASVVLSLSYNTVAITTKTKLFRSRNADIKEAGKKRGALELKRSQVERLSGQEAVAYAIVQNNLLFLLSTVILAFYVFPAAGPTYNYILSVALGAGIVTLLSQSS